MAGSHDPFLVALSFLIAIAASYTALHLSGRVAVSTGRVRALWLVAGSFAMGVGIWSMHFVAMLAFSLHTSIAYNIPLVFLSALVAVAASVFALVVATRAQLGPISLAGGGGVLMGAAIVGMHYIGMAALRADVLAQYDPPLVGASIAVAISASCAALWLAHKYRLAESRAAEIGKVISAVVMGCAIVGMHFTAMAAVSFQPIAASLLPHDNLVLAGSTLTASVALGTLLILATALGAAAVHRRVSHQLLEATQASAAVIRVHEAFLRQVIDADPNLVFVKTRDGRFTLVNRAMAAAYGTTPEELVGKCDADFNPDHDDVQRYLAADQEVIATGITRTVEERLTSPHSGEVRWFLTVKVPLVPDDGGEPQVLGVATEITERKLLADQLRQAQKMDAIGQLTGGIAHDLNNILTVILANADLMADELPPEMDEFREDMRDLQDAAGRGAAMVRKLLAFSRREMVSLRPLALDRLVGDLETTLRRLLPSTINVVIEAESELPTVLGDSGAVEQIVLNLVTNARDAMPTGGIMVLRSLASVLDEEWCTAQGWGKPGHYVCLSISDTGTGIDGATRERMFEPFFTTKPQGAGTGLGLSMVYGLMRQHDGYVNIYSEPGEGTTARLYFPAVAQPSLDISAAASVAAFGGNETILVADDEEGVRRSATRVLERYGYQVFTAVDGEEALQRVTELGDALDLIISDVVMPNMGGRELYRALRAERLDVRFMYTSGYAAREVREAVALEADVPFLHKPWAMTELLIKVREVLDR